ncbi:hypothetical protein REC12_06255 [Desulfosporosinus sp. PR]|uniref:hypothetical protein n=1 Tax=Candidatus Desulfosporosinus nitrosoreducens TaxID=3401928 RepID=UPI0027FEF9BD|nr:hypothetical protein [Desulfosporosinus sp. PR]MDQ7093187.1 hypothetical protein [Desulfosporosinus sp. PR]
MINKLQSKGLKKPVVLILLTVSVLANLILINAYVGRSRELNTAWRNGTQEVVQVGIRLLSAYQGNQSPDADSLTTVNAYTEMLSQQLNSAVALPYGQKIIPFSTVQTVESFINYETSVSKLMQEELKNNGHISTENLKRWKIINDGWHSMFSLMQDELNKCEPFSPVFKEQTWRKIYVDATIALNQVEPSPLPEK